MSEGETTIIRKWNKRNAIQIIESKQGGRKT